MQDLELKVEPEIVFSGVEDFRVLRQSKVWAVELLAVYMSSSVPSFTAKLWEHSNSGM